MPNRISSPLAPAILIGLGRGHMSARRGVLGRLANGAGKDIPGYFGFGNGERRGPRKGVNSERVGLCAGACRAGGIISEIWTIAAQARSTHTHSVLSERRHIARDVVENPIPLQAIEGECRHHDRKFDRALRGTRPLQGGTMTTTGPITGIYDWKGLSILKSRTGKGEGRITYIANT